MSERPSGPAYLHPDGRLAVATPPYERVTSYRVALEPWTPPNGDDLLMSQEPPQPADVATKRGDRQKTCAAVYVSACGRVRCSRKAGHKGLHEGVSQPTGFGAKWRET